MLIGVAFCYNFYLDFGCLQHILIIDVEGV